MRVAVFVCIAWMMVAAGLWVIARWDKPLVFRKRHWCMLFCFALGEGLLVQNKFGEWPFGSVLMLGIFAGCLLLAGMTDSVICQGYNFVWWVALCAGLVLWLQCFVRQEAGVAGVLSLPDLANVSVQFFLFVLLQFIMFGRTYGRADCYGFCVCALVGAALGMGLEEYLRHMIITYLLLIVVQAFRRNISRWGRLKQPVPFLPYINFAFWMTILFFYS